MGFPIFPPNHPKMPPFAADFRYDTSSSPRFSCAFAPSSPDAAPYSVAGLLNTIRPPAIAARAKTGADSERTGSADAAGNNGAIYVVGEPSMVPPISCAIDNAFCAVDMPSRCCAISPADSAIALCTIPC